MNDAEKARHCVVPFALSAIIRGIQKRRCSRIDTHQLPLGLPVRLTHGHQKIYSLSDLLKIRESKGIPVQMLQNTATFEETFERVLSNRKANGLSDKTLQTCNNR